MSSLHNKACDFNRGLFTENSDGRIQMLLTWIQQDLGLRVESWERVVGDASARRYYRVWTPAGSLIAMDAPPPENLKAFVAVAELLQDAGMRVPRIHGQQIEHGFALLEDFGDRTYLQVLNPTLAEGLYADALAALYRLQTRIDPARCGLPPYAETLLERELEIFRQWLLERWLGLEIPEAIWKASVELLVGSALEQPKVVVHRDYHSRNLMVLPEGTPGVLDFQDAVVGPVTYDVVSLLRDCYLALPKPWVEHWREAYRQRLAAAGMEISPQTWAGWFDRMGAQRHLKAAGIFARLWLRDRRPGYLKDIPRTLGYVVEVAREDDGLRGLGEFLTGQVVPRVAGKLGP